MKGNCKNCRHLDYFDADFESFFSSGFMCNKREDDSLAVKMESESYLEKAKVCHDPKLNQRGTDNE